MTILGFLTIGKIKHELNQKCDYVGQDNWN